jgi:heme/copper-type cytochrome/quinol oxidase subunit 2
MDAVFAGLFIFLVICGFAFLVAAICSEYCKNANIGKKIKKEILIFTITVIVGVIVSFLLVVFFDVFRVYKGRGKYDINEDKVALAIVTPYLLMVAFRLTLLIARLLKPAGHPQDIETG